MYRHFAVITIALTSALALFADGETRATADEDVSSQRQDDTERLANQDGFSAPPRAASAPVGAGEFGEETGLGFGQPMASAPDSGGSVQSNEGAPVPGYSQAYLDTLPEAERRALLEGLARNGLLSDTERQRQAEALSAQSARQSGAAKIAD